MKTKNMIFLVVLILAGCAEGNKMIEPCPHYNRLQVATFYGDEKPDKKAYGTVKPYFTAKDVPKPYEAIAFMTCDGSAAEEAAILKAMLYRAADLGGDGVLLGADKISQESTESKDVNVTVKRGWMAFIGNGASCAFRAQVIRFKK